MQRKQIAWGRRLMRGLLAVMLAVSAPSFALIIPPPTSQARPPVTVAAIGQPMNAIVTWSVVSSIPQGPYTVTSTSAQFVAGGTVVETVNTPISAIGFNPNGQYPATVSITESVVIPPEVTVRASRLGAATFTYVRTFNDGGGPVQLAANFVIGGGGAASFSVTRVALSFDDGTVARIVEPEAVLHASAMLYYTGSGSLSAVWELADPASTSGAPIFRTLQPVVLGLGWGSGKVIAAPELPTVSRGLYLLRLRIISPAPSFDPPVLRYFVGMPSKGGMLPATPIAVLNPPDGAFIDRETGFAWDAVKGARAYKIDIFESQKGYDFDLPDIGEPAPQDSQRQAYEALSSAPVVGLLVDAKKTDLPLSALVFSKIQRRKQYYWRVQAIDNAGKIVSESAPRAFRIP